MLKTTIELLVNAIVAVITAIAKLIVWLMLAPLRILDYLISSPYHIHNSVAMRREADDWYMMASMALYGFGEYKEQALLDLQRRGISTDEANLRRIMRSTKNYR